MRTSWARARDCQDNRSVRFFLGGTAYKGLRPDTNQLNCVSDSAGFKVRSLLNRLELGGESFEVATGLGELPGAFGGACIDVLLEGDEGLNGNLLRVNLLGIDLVLHNLNVCSNANHSRC